MKPITPGLGEGLLELGKRCNAVYVCPKVGSERKGPLVVYAGKDGQGRNLVGDIYFNFRRIEAHPRAVQAFAEAACRECRISGHIETAVGMHDLAGHEAGGVRGQEHDDVGDVGRLGHGTERHECRLLRHLRLRELVAGLRRVGETGCHRVTHRTETVPNVSSRSSYPRA